jgi:hypothetical protein
MTKLPPEESESLPSNQPWQSPWGWYGSALLPIGIGLFMYAMEASDLERFRLLDPVPAVGEFVSAECKYFRRHNQHYMAISYAFVARGYAPYVEPGAAAQPTPTFTVQHEYAEYASPDDCEAALPAVRAAKQSHPVWFERSNPHAAKTSLEEPDSTRFLWVGLGAIPLALVGWLLGRRRRAALGDGP